MNNDVLNVLYILKIIINFLYNTENNFDALLNKFIFYFHKCFTINPGN